MQFTYEYDAWGNFEAYDASGNKISTSGRTSPTSAEPTKLCDKNPFKYRGYFYDWQTGLYYLQSRYYDPSTGRFISVDSFEYADPETVDGLNLYAYCKNNPVMNVDPTGTFFGALLAGFFLGGLISGSVSAVFAAYNGENWLGAFVGGFITGAALGIAMVLGGGLAVGAIKATVRSVIGIGAFITAGTFGAGIAAYYAENYIKGAPMDINNALKNGAITLTQGIFSFGIGAAMGVAGFFESLKSGNGYWNVFKTLFGKGGIKTWFNGTVSYLGINGWAISVRVFMKSIFTSPWNLIKF